MRLRNEFDHAVPVQVQVQVATVKGCRLTGGEEEVGFMRKAVAFPSRDDVDIYLDE